MRISIITVCFNSASYLEYTIRSVIGQTYQNWELIVIDGNSNDETVSIIKRYEPWIFYWCSEPDNGMYDAINKGLAKATGNYYLILNSDDFLHNSFSLELAVNYLQQKLPLLAYGNLVKQIGNKQKKVNLFPIDFKRLLLSTHGTFVPHPSTFVSASLHGCLEKYSMAYRYASDFDYILRALKLAGKNKIHMPIYVTVFRMHNASITASGKIEEERLKILSAHNYYSYSVFTRKLSYIILWLFYKTINLRNKFIFTKFWA